MVLEALPQVVRRTYSGQLQGKLGEELQEAEVQTPALPRELHAWTPGSVTRAKHSVDHIFENFLQRDVAEASSEQLVPLVGSEAEPPLL